MATMSAGIEKLVLDLTFKELQMLRNLTGIDLIAEKADGKYGRPTTGAMFHDSQQRTCQQKDLDGPLCPASWSCLSRRAKTMHCGFLYRLMSSSVAASIPTEYGERTTPMVATPMESVEAHGREIKIATALCSSFVAMIHRIGLSTTKACFNTQLACKILVGIAWCTVFSVACVLLPASYRQHFNGRLRSWFVSFTANQKKAVEPAAIAPIPVDAWNTDPCCTISPTRNGPSAPPVSSSTAQMPMNLPELGASGEQSQPIMLMIPLDIPLPNPITRAASISANPPEDAPSPPRTKKPTLSIAYAGTPVNFLPCLSDSTPTAGKQHESARLMRLIAPPISATLSPILSPASGIKIRRALRTPMIEKATYPAVHSVCHVSFATPQVLNAGCS